MSTKTKLQNQLKIVSFKLPISLVTQIDKRAKEKQRSRSWIIREDLIAATAKATV